MTGRSPWILFVDQFSELGGAQHVLLDLLPALEGRFEPLFALPGPGPFPEELARRGIGWTPLAVGRYSLGAKSAGDLLRYVLRQPALAARITELARSCGAALIYANGPRLFPPSAAAARRLGTPLLWHLHLELRQARDRLLVAAAARVGRPQVIACSRACLAPFPASCFFRRSAAVVYGGVSPVEIAAHPPGLPVIGVIGRLHPDKGQMDLLRAAPEILRAAPEARFRFVGPVADEAYAHRLRELSARLGPGRVEFAGPAASPAAALCGLDILVAPSRRESFGRVILEAFSAGVPVAAADAGGIPEVIEPELDGLLFRAGNPRDLARAVSRLLNERGLSERLTRAARESFRRRWSVERFRREMLELLVEMAQPRRGRQTARRQPRPPLPAP